jgi:hypothetical protein
MNRSLADLTILNNPHAPDLFIDDCPGFNCLNGVMRVTLAAVRSDYSTPAIVAHRVVVGRLVMSVAAARLLVTEVHDFMQKHDLNPPPIEPESPRVIQ